MGMLAEHLINNAETLPNHYSTAEVWNHYRGRFLPLVQEPALAPFREATERAGRVMLEAVNGLTSALSDCNKINYPIQVTRGWSE
jgi:hypothetical protein